MDHTKSNDNVRDESPEPAMKRVVGLWGAVFLGLGSILGTGVFVSLGLGAEVAGEAVVWAVVLAGLIATCNGLSSAQLAAAHPVSGGTYEYGYQYLHPRAGFLAGWLFLLAKSASAATAALGLVSYTFAAGAVESTAWIVPIAFGFVLLWTWLVAGGIQRSNQINMAIVGFTLIGLIAWMAFTFGKTRPGAVEPAAGYWPEGLAFSNWLEAAALLFVAFTGYGRVATLGEEVRDPRRTIPRAVIMTLVVSILLYVGVAAVALAYAGAAGLTEATATSGAPLEILARDLGVPGLTTLVGMAAVTAMAGVLLNLLLGLSRVLLAMGRRGDMPKGLAQIEKESGSPVRAVYAIGFFVAALVWVGDMKSTWSFSAFTVLVYYAFTNLCALKLPSQDRMFPRVIPMLGLVGCLGLAFWVEPRVWMAGLGAIGLGLIWHTFALTRRA